MKERLKKVRFMDISFIVIILFLLGVEEIDITMSTPFIKREVVHFGSFPIDTNVTFKELPLVNQKDIEKVPVTYSASVPSNKIVRKESKSTKWTPIRYNGKTPTDYIKHWSYTFIVESNSYKEATGIDIPVSIKIAQVALETGWGQKSLDDFNHFNIKDHGYRPHIPRSLHDEAITGSIYKNVGEHNNTFLKFKTPWLASRYHSYFICAPHYLRWYNNSYAKTLKNPERWAYALQKGRYAGHSKTYGQKLLHIIDRYNLRQYDNI